jgi:hypothetical protein
MTTIKQTHAPRTQRVRRIAHALALGAVATVATLLRPAVRRGLAASGMAAALAAGSVLTPQFAAADTAYPVSVTFLRVTFTQTNDGWGDSYLDVYGTVAAYTSAGPVSAGGLPYRNFGTWGQNPAGCPPTDGSVPWGTSTFTTAKCLKSVNVGAYGFATEKLCPGTSKSACTGAYNGYNNTIPLQVHPGEQIILAVAIQDYDETSANDNVCVGNIKFGPYTAAQLQAKQYVYDSQFKTIAMAYNGDAGCAVSFILQ